MARRRSDPVLQKLRSLARRGRRTEAGEYLAEILLQQPEHARAKEEYMRYMRSQPFSFEEMDYTELQTIISDFLASPQRLATMRSSALKRLRQRAHYLRQAQEHVLSMMEKKTLSQLHTNINRELKRRRKPLGKISIIASCAAGVLLLLGGGMFFLYERAEHAAKVLDNAVKTQVSNTTAANLLHIHDTGLNRTLNRRVGVEADSLRLYIQTQKKAIRELDAMLKVIETGESTVVDQGVRRRADIERKLKALGQNAGQLKQRWAALCNAERDALNQQRLALAEELMAPLPPGQELSHDAMEDYSIISKRNKILEQRLNIYEDVGEALQLSEELVTTILQEYNQNRLILEEINKLRNTLQLLPAAHDYDAYQRRLKEWEARHYQPAISLLSIYKKLPARKKIRKLMQEYGQDVKPGLFIAAQKSLLEGEPSFSQDFPASREQLIILKELLDNSALGTLLYEHIDTATNERALAESMPEIRSGRACFMRSLFDPQRDVSDEKQVEWHNPDAVVTRTIDPRPLHTQLGFDNPTGFLTTANLPEILTRVFHIEGNNIPALARAYVLHHIVKAMNAAEEPLLNGLRYAPETRAALADFNKLRKSCDIRLDGNCWLQYTQKHVIAESRFASWFAEHQELDFQRELKENLTKFMNVKPQFCGYINEYAQPVVFATLKRGQRVWYLKQDGSIATAEWGSGFHSPHLLSPLFTKETQY